VRLVVAALALLATTLACTGNPDAIGDGLAVVTHVVDGDTIDVEIGGRTERVRLIGIDTPETKKSNTPIECWGPEASAFTASLLPEGTEVRIERDVVGRDDYGRLLGYWICARWPHVQSPKNPLDFQGAVRVNLLPRSPVHRLRTRTTSAVSLSPHSAVPTISSE